ncbi:MAG: dTMP kinase [Actinomycetota bacterium]|nr:dTMP kinase [Actinomycetota bacterium]
MIALEGGEAAGKSTQAVLLAERLGAVLTREPGGTAIGRRVRDLLLDPGTSALDARAEALLVAADRAQHVREVILPALEAGRDVVTDRYSASTLAYQGWGRGLEVEDLRCLSSWASFGVEPDVVVLLDVPADVAAARLGEAGLDRFEAQDGGFHLRVAEGYRALAAADPHRWVVVDASQPPDAVAARVWEACCP